MTTVRSSSFPPWLLQYGSAGEAWRTIWDMSVETTSEHGGESEEAAYDLDPSDRLANLIFYWREREKKKNNFFTMLSQTYSFILTNLPLKTVLKINQRNRQHLWSAFGSIAFLQVCMSLLGFSVCYHQAVLELAPTFRAEGWGPD